MSRLKLKFKYENISVDDTWEQPEGASWPQILAVDGGSRRVLIAWAEEVPEDTSSPAQ